MKDKKFSIIISVLFIIIETILLYKYYFVGAICLGIIGIPWLIVLYTMDRNIPSLDRYGKFIEVAFASILTLLVVLLAMLTSKGVDLAGRCYINTNDLYIHEYKDCIMFDEQSKCYNISKLSAYICNRHQLCPECIRQEQLILEKKNREAEISRKQDELKHLRVSQVDYVVVLRNIELMKRLLDITMHYLNGDSIDIIKDGDVLNLLNEVYIKYPNDYVVTDMDTIDINVLTMRSWKYCADQV